MKLKKPETVQMFKCADGKFVETLPEWKRAQLVAKLAERLTGESGPSLVGVADALVANADEFIAILAVSEKGRPKGAKDKTTPRVKRAVETAAAKAA